MDFIKKLDDTYELWKEMECPPKNKYEFLGSAIFDFTTYDSSMDELFAKKMLEVLDAIVSKETFDYIDKNYENYLLMINMPFLQDKLDWGTSIRGAWFENYGDGEYEIDCGRIMVKKTELEEFIKAILKWVK